MTSIRITNHREVSNPEKSTKSLSPPLRESTASSQSNGASFRDLMRYERLRLLTYLLLGHQWPKMEVVSPAKLAAAGFFYYGGDTVKCPFCSLIVSDWEAGDDPMEEHRKGAPGCEFFKLAKNVSLEVDPDLNSNTVENSFTSPPEVVTSSITPTHEQSDVPYNLTDTPRFALFKDNPQRLNTFRKKGWNCPVDGRLFAHAGFFWTGKEDRCRCFHCGGLLYGWKKGENPMEEHAKFFPQCYFLHSMQGKTYVEYVQFKMQIISLREKIDEDSSLESSLIKKRDIDCMKSMSYDNFVAMKIAASNVFDKLERSNNGKGYYKKYADKFFLLVDCQVLYQHLISMNLLEPSSNTGRGLVRASSPCSDNGYNSDEFVGTLSTSSQGSSASNSSQGSAHSTGGVFSFSDDGSTNLSLSSSSSDDNNSDEDGETTVLSQRLRGSVQLKGKDDDERKNYESLQCIICCENRIEVVFTPCGHQMACTRCASKFDSCPVCRQKIKQKIRTYLIN